jgi:hypothetical protein
MKVCQAWVRAAVICRALRAAIDSEGRRRVSREECGSLPFCTAKETVRGALVPDWARRDDYISHACLSRCTAKTAILRPKAHSSRRTSDKRALRRHNS